MNQNPGSGRDRKHAPAADAQSDAGLPVSRGRSEGSGGFRTPGYVHVPHMAEKVELLRKHHPTIATDRDFAKKLGVAPSTFANWKNGVPSPDGVRVNPGCVPVAEWNSFVSVFELPGEVIEMQDLAEFANVFRTFELGRGAWDKLIRRVVDDETIEIDVNLHRQLIDPDEQEEDDGLLRVLSQDEIMLRVRNPGFQYGALLQKDGQGWWCMRPSSRWREMAVDDTMVWPRPAPDGTPRFATIEGGGVHFVLAIFTMAPLPDKHLDMLLAKKPIDIKDLDRIAAFFEDLFPAGPDKCRMFSRRFVVSNARRPKPPARSAEAAGRQAAPTEKKERGERKDAKRSTAVKRKR